MFIKPQLTRFLFGDENVPTCRDCYLYKPADAKRGVCIDMEVSADMNIENCKRTAFRPKYFGI